MQRYSIDFGLGGLAITAIAPEIMVGELAAGAGGAMYIVGTGMKDSVSITNLIFSNRNGSGYLLGKINEFLLNDIPAGPVRDLVASKLDSTEENVGLSGGDSGLCKEN